MKQFLLLSCLAMFGLLLPQQSQAQGLQVSLSGPDSVCLFQTNWQMYTANASGGAGGYTYNWSSPIPLSVQSNNRIWANFQNVTAGTYPITVCVTDSFGGFACDTLHVLTIAGCQPIQVNFGHWPDTVCVGRPIQFWDSIQYASGSTAITWDFGDGNISNQQWNVTHVYSQAGTYNVSLCVIDSIRNDTVCAYDTVIVSGNCPSIGVTTVGPDTLCMNSPRGAFTSQISNAQGTQLSWLWSVNGQNFTTQGFAYTFPGPGTYPISLRNRLDLEAVNFVF